MPGLKQLLFGEAYFPESEEFRRFQYQLLCIVLLAGAICTALLLPEWNLYFRQTQPSATQCNWRNPSGAR
jgi:hypothetical protein